MIIYNYNIQWRFKMSDLQQLIKQKEILEKQLVKIEKMRTKENENKILDAIKNRRWFFFKNNPNVLMDKETGYLWANLDYFPYSKDNNVYSKNSVNGVINRFDFLGINGFRLPDISEFNYMIKDKTFPFKKGNNWRILDKYKWYVNYKGKKEVKDLDCANITTSTTSNYSSGYILPCSSILVEKGTYAKDVSKSNKKLTEVDKAKLTLDLFLKNKLEPKFINKRSKTENEELTKIYRALYREGRELSLQLEKIKKEISKLKAEELLSKNFNYEELLKKYDTESIDKSVIKYYKAIQSWTNDLMNKLDLYEKEKEDTIQNFNLISLKLSKEYENDKNLTEEENSIFKNRQKYFKSKLLLGLNSTKDKILAVRNAADNIKNRLDDINSGTDPLRELGILENETRASFELVAENTANIITEALEKINFFENNSSYINKAVEILEKWTDDYKIFKTAYKEKLKVISEEDDIEEEIWAEWYKDWENKRILIENKIQPVIDKGFDHSKMGDNNEIVSYIISMVDVLEKYKNSIDSFYLEERKAIHQKYAFVPGGELQEKFEMEKMVYDYASEFCDDIQKIVFGCEVTENKIFILKWSNDIMDLHIDDVLAFVADKDLQKISKKVLAEFAAIKKKNYDVYLSDAKSYSEAKARRDKEYNSLMYKMRKELSK